MTEKYQWAGDALDDELAETTRRLALLRQDFEEIVAASTDSNADDEHDPEGATIAFERSQVGALIEQAQMHLAEIESAQSRLTDGSYGMCETCGGPIALGRLKARPIARRCIDCAAAAE